MVKFLAGSLMIVAGGLVGGKFYTEYKIEQSLDKVFEMASLAMDASYGDATLNLDGSFSITDLRASEIGSTDEISIDEINFNSSSNWVFVTQFYKSADDKFKAWIQDQPEKISIKFDNVNFSADNENMKSMGMMISGCGNINEIGSDALSELGYDRINVDFDMKFDMSDKAHSKLELLTRVDEIADMDIVYNMDFSNFNVTSLSSGEIPELKSIDFGIVQDQHFSANSIAYCAKQMNLSTEEYLATVVGDPSYMKGSGLVPDQAMMDAVVALAQGARLDVTLEPSISFSNFGQLKFYKPQDAVQLMGLTVHVDGKQLNDIVIDTEGFEIMTADWQNKDYSATKVSDAKPAKVGYHKVSRDQLSGLVGYHIKVHRVSAGPMVGKLLSTSAGKVNIEQRRYGGSVTFPIENKDITSLEAYY